MIAPVLRYALARLTDGTTGVNALRTSVPKGAGESAPAAVTVRGELAHASRTLGLLAPEMLDGGPLLLVSHVGTTEVRAGDGAVTLAVRYAGLQVDPDAYARDAWQILRCAARALSVGPFTGDMAAQHVTQDSATITTLPVLAYASPPAGSVDVFDPCLLATYAVTDRWSVGAA